MRAFWRANLMWLKKMLNSTAMIAAEVIPEWKMVWNQLGKALQNVGATIGISPARSRWRR